jgi:hypothetical protein
MTTRYKWDYVTYKEGRLYYQASNGRNDELYHPTRFIVFENEEHASRHLEANDLRATIL